MEHILRNVLLTLLDQPKADLRDINKILVNRSFAEECLIHITNPEVYKF